MVKDKYRGLNQFTRKGKDGELKYSIVSKSMINLTNGSFIPSVFESILSSVQNET